MIQTLHGRGYRFLAQVEERTADSTKPAAEGPASGEIQIAPKAVSLSAQPSALSTASVVGREEELAYLHRWLQRALDGTRQIVFLTGEAGLGKTTVVDAFIEEARGRGVQWIGRGQCGVSANCLHGFGRLNLQNLISFHGPWCVKCPRRSRRRKSPE
jgi:chromosomal replication initiation ATPase DnaA